jgi:hypothetical protein
MKFNGNGNLLNDNFITGNYLYYFTFYNNLFYCLNINLSQMKTNQTNSENINYFSMPTSSIISKYDLNGVFVSNNKIDLSFNLFTSDNNGNLYYAEKNVIYKINIAPVKESLSQNTTSNVVQDSGSSALCMMCILICCIMISSSSSAMLKPF